MDALLVYKNDVRQVSAELRAAASTAFDLDWIPNRRKEIGITVRRVDDHGSHVWKLGPLFVGDTVSLITAEVNEINEPDEFFTPADLERIQKNQPKLKRGKRPTAKVREIADLFCQISKKQVCSVRLKSNNLFSAGFVWLDDRNGRSVMHIGLGGSSPAIKVPKINFGDEVTFISVSVY